MPGMENNWSERKEVENKVLHSQSRKTLYSEYKYTREGIKQERSS
jgi:hypothetical protein